MPGIPTTRWHEVSPSRHSHERAALRWLREQLPEYEPWRGWTNFEFTAIDGSVNEVDALIVGRTGVYLVEIKSHTGHVSGDSRTLTFSDAAGRRQTIDHPLHLANLKAKRLKDLLRRTTALARSAPIWLQPIVFLEGATGASLVGPAAQGVYFRKTTAAAAAPRHREHPGALAALEASGDPGVPDLVDALVLGEHLPRSMRPLVIDKLLAKTIERALAELGVRGRREAQFAGDYVLGELLDESEVYRDVRGTHRSLPGDHRRVRRYFTPADSGALHAQDIRAAAEREARLLQRLDHPGILRCTHFTADEQGPILFLEDVPRAERLDRFLNDRRGAHGASQLSAEEQFRLLRLLAEAVQHAHGRQTIHRCLSPASVLVVPAAPSTAASASSHGPVSAVKILNWQAGVRDDSSLGPSSILQATLHPDSYHDRSAGAYLAPELHRAPGDSGPTLDVFSLGAIAYLLVTGSPPERSAEALRDRLAREGCLRPSCERNGVLRSIDELVTSATAHDVARRLPDVPEFLEKLEAVERELARPTSICTDPGEAGPDALLADGTRIVRRLGSGAHAIAFLVERPHGDGVKEFVLKIARSPSSSRAIEAERDVVRQLDHPNLVRFEGECSIGSFAGFLTSPKSLVTLRQRLREDGALHLELLDRFGAQLLEALAWLETKGIAHRDLKPDNIAISDLGQKAAQRIVLFDFSASRAPAEEIEVGTPMYLDPFLAERRPRRWDTAAERYSAGLVLHEMATGQLPIWGDGRSDPAAIKGEISLDANLFASGVREALHAFFRRALARTPAARFGNAPEMLDAWRGIFSATRHAPVTDAPDDIEQALDRQLVAGSNTPLNDLPLGTRALNAIDRLQLHTVADLLRTPHNRLLRARGVGQKTRDELSAMARALRRRFPTIAIDPNPKPKPNSSPAPVANPAQPGVNSVDASAASSDSLDSIETLFAQLVAATPEPTRRRVAVALLGVESVLSPERNDATSESGPHAIIDLPTQTEAGQRSGSSRQNIAQMMPKLRSAWAGLPWIDVLRDRLAERLARLGGIATALEAAEHLVAESGDATPGPAAGPFVGDAESPGNPNDRAGDSSPMATHAVTRLRLAAALVRAATEVEADATAPRWSLRRREWRQYLAVDDDLVHFAEGLCPKAEAIAKSDPLPDRAAAERALSLSPRDRPMPFLPDRLVRLAAAVCNGGRPPIIGVSSRGELYPAGLDPAKALTLCAGAVATAGTLVSSRARRIVTPQDLADLIRTRYPLAAPLPPRPELDSLLRSAGLALEWSDSEGGYVASIRERDSVPSASTVPSRLDTVLPQAPRPHEAQSPAQREAAHFDRRLREIARARKLLVLRTWPRFLERATEQLRRAVPDLEVGDLDALLLDAIDAFLREKRIDPNTFYGAEATGTHQHQVQQVMSHAIAAVSASLAGGTRPLLLLNPGMLARCGDWRPIDRFNSLLGEATSRTCFVLVPEEDLTVAQPTLDGQRIPTLGPEQHAVIPEAWLNNAHRAAVVA